MLGLGRDSAVHGPRPGTFGGQSETESEALTR